MATKRTRKVAVDDAVEKKKPGRPKKQTVICDIEMRGVVSAPVCPDDIIELVYGDPMMFKKILQLCKAFGVNNLELHFTTDSAKLLMRDHLGKSTIVVTVHGKCMNLYHCRSSVRLCTRREDLELVLNNLNKNHYKITFLVKEELKTTLFVVVKDTELNNDDTYEVEMTLIPDDTDYLARPADSDENYPLKFKIPSKHFKNKVCNTNKISDTFTIQKCGTEALQLTCDKTGKVSWTGAYNDATKIDLQSKLSPNDIFNVSVSIAYIKPFSDACIGDETLIAVDKREKISFTTWMNENGALGPACTIKVFTEIKDYGK